VVDWIKHVFKVISK